MEVGDTHCAALAQLSGHRSYLPGVAFRLRLVRKEIVDDESGRYLMLSLVLHFDHQGHSHYPYDRCSVPRMDDTSGDWDYHWHGPWALPLR